MKLGYSLTAALMGTVAVAGLVQLAVSLTPTQVNEIAKKITVRIDGAAPGTGVIVRKEGNNYTVLTNHHVVGKSGKYTAQTSDGKSYPVNAQTIKKLGDVDLAVFEFTSSESYQVAELGDSEQISEGIPVHVVGWAAPDAVNPERGYVFTNGSISRRVAKAKNGYALVYTNTVKPGMSGGAVLNEEGRLVGINGLAVADLNTGGTDYLGIPINTYAKLAKLPSSPPVNVAEIPRRTTVIPTPPRRNDNVAYNPGYNFTLAKSLTGHSESVDSVAISPDGQTLASGSFDKTIKIWDLRSGELRRTLQGHSESVDSVAISPDGQTLASGSLDKTIKIWDLRSGELRRTLQGHSDWVSSVTISPDGRTLASGSEDKTIKIWDISSGKLRRTVTVDGYPIASVIISSDGKTLVSYGSDIKIWDLGSGKLHRTFTPPEEAPRKFTKFSSVAISPDGKTLAAGTVEEKLRGKVIKIWDISSGKLHRTLTAHSDWVHSIAISPDGRTLVSGSRDSTIKIWDLRSGELRRTLTGHSDWVNSVAISPDGKTLASGSLDKTIKIWRLAGR
jgi:WD40 repeat protein